MFERIEDFESYPHITDAVRSVRVTRDGSDTLTSHWEVNFRNGILKWQEEDRVDRDARRIRFDQVAGDLAAFSGEWAVDERDGGAVVRFTGEFDLGIPSLAPMLDPVAERALGDNVAELIAAFASPHTAVFAEPVPQT
ncbi:MAG TPA: SRPBCC family protein [Thermoleophilaceae bacterium]